MTDELRQRLWAPWRLDYIRGDVQSDEPKPEDDAEKPCFLCEAVAADEDRQRLVIARGSLVFAILNRYPHNNGHLLIAPTAHKGQLSELTTEEHTQCMELVTRSVEVIRSEMNAAGFNVGLNLGRVAGAGLPGHLHWHVVPRWNGDTNFMPVFGDVDVISQSLDSAWQLLSEAF
jgi:ATP adenylyltransferase